MATSEHPVDFSAGFSCPTPIMAHKNVLLAHGGGGRLTQQLIQRMFVPILSNPHLDPLHDGAMVALGGKPLALSTDSFVVSPIFFPGGNIGDLAVNGTVNDLAMCGAVPRFLSCGLIIEEGLPMEELERVVTSLRKAADRAGVAIVTGDTKVVDRGKADRLFINTAGIGEMIDGIAISPAHVQPGDAIILSGEIATHGIAIMSVREGLEFETAIATDSAPLHELTMAVLQVCPRTRVLRDPTRGGVASVLNEIAEASNVGIEIKEAQIPMNDEVRGACEILGLDPLYVANEGKMIAIVPPDAAARVLDTMRSHQLGEKAAIIGQATSEHRGTVVLESKIGGSRVVDMLSGEQLPRIC